MARHEGRDEREERVEIGRQVDVHVGENGRSARRPRGAQRPPAALGVEMQRLHLIEFVGEPARDAPRVVGACVVGDGDEPAEREASGEIFVEPAHRRLEVGFLVVDGQHDLDDGAASVVSPGTDGEEIGGAGRGFVVHARIVGLRAQPRLRRYLEFAESARGDAKPARRSVTRMSGSAGQPYVLVVDDEEHITEMLAMGLGFNGFEVERAASGRAALDAIDRRRPDLVVLDVMLPDLDGFEVARRLRRSEGAGAHVPVIFLTARDTTQDKVEGLRLGSDDYVTKPFSIEELIERVKAVLRRSAGIGPGEKRLSYADLELDEDTRDVWRGGAAHRAHADRVQAAPLSAVERAAGADA